MADALRPPRTWDSPGRHFDSALQHPWYRAVYRLQSTIITSNAAFFDGLGFDPVLMPVTTPSVSSPMGLGSDSLPVSVRIMDRETYLADSMQFQLEYLLRHGASGVYYIMPSFRGENHSSRHLNEFHHSEIEMLGGFEDLLGVAAKFVVALTADLLKRHGALIREAAGTLRHIEEVLKVGEAIPRISQVEAQRLLSGEPGAFEALKDGSVRITARGERSLLAKTGGIVFLTHPPHSIVPFYQAYSPDGIHAEAADLLLGIGETLGCGERHRTRAEAETALKRHGVAETPYGWYLDLKERYPLRTGGFGMGLERYLAWMLRHEDIRDIPLIPRIGAIASAP